jgi:excisionase family DNA binding protein
VNELSVKEVADQLGVSEIQVGRLIGFGELRAQRFGKAWAVDRRSVQRYHVMRAGRGRPLAAASAWPSLLEAEPHSIDDAIELARRCRRRAERFEGAVSPGKFGALLSDRHVVVSGVAAAAVHGAAVDENPPHVVYAKRSQFDALVKRYRIDADHSAPNRVVFIVDDEHWPFESRVAPPVVALVDLVSEADHRSAREVLAEMNP